MARWCVHVLASLAAAAAVAAAAAAAAQPTGQIPESGAYESWSPVDLRPVGPLAGRARGLPGWLEVRRLGDGVEVAFRPGDRVRWRVRWGPHGPVERIEHVDGVAVRTSRFDYDARGHLARRRTVGLGVAGAERTAIYRTDATGRVVERREDRYVQRWGSELIDEARWQLARTAAGVTATLWVHDRLVREDHYDAEGRLRESHFHARDHRGVIRVARDEAGRAVGLRRSFDDGAFVPARGRARSAAALAFAAELAPDPAIARWELRALLGPPLRATDRETGAERALVDHYRDDSCRGGGARTFAFDATGLLEARLLGRCVE